jgi:hypothetical protein
MNAEGKEMHEQLREFLDRRPDVNVSKVINGWLFDPHNRFDPNARARLRPEILILLSYLFLMGAVFAIFNLPS